MVTSRDMTRWKKKEVEELFRTSRCLFADQLISIRVAPCPLHRAARLLIIVPKKAGNAPQRNRFKRRVRAIFYENNLYQKGFDWIVFGKEEGVLADFAAIQGRVLGGVQKLSRTPLSS